MEISLNLIKDSGSGDVQIRNERSSLLGLLLPERHTTNFVLKDSLYLKRWKQYRFVLEQKIVAAFSVE